MKPARKLEENKPELIVTLETLMKTEWKQAKATRDVENGAHCPPKAVISQGPHEYKHLPATGLQILDLIIYGVRTIVCGAHGAVFLFPPISPASRAKRSKTVPRPDDQGRKRTFRLLNRSCGCTHAHDHRKKIRTTNNIFYFWISFFVACTAFASRNAKMIVARNNL